MKHETRNRISGKRWARGALRVLGVLLLLSCSLIGLVLVTANLPWVRARLAREVSQRVSDAIAGSVSITRIGHVGFSSVSGIDAVLFDPRGQRVLAINDSSVNLDASALLFSLFAGDALMLVFERIQLAQVNLHLQNEADGELNLVSAIAPVSAADEPASAESQTGAARSTDWRFEQVAIDEALVHGSVGGIEDLDVALRNLEAAGSFDEQNVNFNLRKLVLEVRHLPAFGQIGGELSAAGTLELPAQEGETLALRASAQFSGGAAGVAVDARVIYDASELAGYLELAAPSDSIRRLVLESSLQERATLYVGFEGSLAALHVITVLESDGGNLYADGDVSVSPQLAGTFSLIGSELDAGSWFQGLPDSAIQFASAFRFELEHGTITGRLALRTWSARWGTLRVPDLGLLARLEEHAASAELRSEVSGGAARMRVAIPHFEAVGLPKRIQIDLGLRVPDAARLAHELGLAAPLRGRLQVEASAGLEIAPTPLIEGGRLSVTLDQGSMTSMEIASGTLQASAEGPWANPHLTFSLRARRLSLLGYPLEQVTLNGRGTAARVSIQGGFLPERAPPARLTAIVLPWAQAIEDISLRMDAVEPAAEPLHAAASRLAFAPSGLELRGFRTAGWPGRLGLDGSVRGDRVRLRGNSTQFSGAAMARQLGLRADLPTGVADLAFDLDYRPGHLSGTLKGIVNKICTAKIRGVSVEADLQIDNSLVSGVASASLRRIARAQLSARSLDLPTRWELEQLARLRGDLDITLTADLARIGGIPAVQELTAWKTRGKLDARLTIHGVDGDSPNVQLALSTQDLAWWYSATEANRAALADAAQARRAVAPWRALDVTLAASLERSRIEATATLVGAAGGKLAELHGTTRLPIERLLSAHDSISVRDLPIDLRLDVPTRALRDLPLAIEGIEGRFGAEITATGRLGQPELSADLHLLQLEITGQDAMPLDISARAKLQGRELEASARVRNERRELVSLDGRAQVTGGGAPPGLSALDLELRSNGLPLEPFGLLLGRGLSGELYGSLSAEGLEKRPRISGTLWVNAPVVDGFRQEQVRWAIDAGPDSFVSQVLIQQGDGRARLNISGPWRWRERLLPALQPELARAELEATNFELRALRPLLPEAAQNLSGRLFADVSIGAGHARELSGNIYLRRGIIYVDALGQQFHDVELVAKADPSGVVQLERLSARGLKGRLNAKGRAKLDGLLPTSATLTANIPKGDPLAFMFEGVMLGDAWGRFDIDARADLGPAAAPRRLQVGVNTPRLHVRLPEQSPHDVQELEDDPTIAAGTYLGPGKFISLPLPPYEAELEPGEEETPVIVQVDLTLGDDVWIERSTQMEVKLAGQVSLRVRDELTAQGEMRITRGTLDVQGRIFEIERGVITFVEERAPSNPTVVATARYTAPEGTEVYAEFVGPVETGNLSLRSEPPLRDDQILSLLLFGSADGNFGVSEAGGGDPLSGAALAAGGSVVTRGLNQELRRLTSLDIQTRIGESEGQPRPEVVVQLSPRLTAELAYSLQAPTPGRAHDRTYLTLDLRLLRNWSLSTTLGDAGSLLLDLLWRYRY